LRRRRKNSKVFEPKKKKKGFEKMSKNGPKPFYISAGPGGL